MLKGNKKYNFYSLYKPPQVEISSSNWQLFLQSLERPFVLCGDFNAHHISWGSSITDRHGSKLLQAIEEEQLVIMNDDSPTRLTSPNTTNSVIDLCIVSDGLAAVLEWKVSEEVLGSDHFAITISLKSSQGSTENSDGISGPPRWNLKKANWAKFQINMERLTKEAMSRGDFSYDKFTTNLEKSCEDAIPKIHQGVVPSIFKRHWWTEECQLAVDIRKQKMQAYKRDPTLYNLLQYKNAAAVVKKTILNSKRSTWRNFCSNLNKNTPTKQIWNEIKKLKNSELKYKHQASLGEWSQDFFDSLTPAFVVPDSPIFTNQHEEIPPEAEYLTNPISMRELELSLKYKHNSAPGLDQIHYPMLYHLPLNAKEVLKSIFNNILDQASPPDQWRKFKIVPILKPNKDPQLASSYRPISLASCVLKTFERIIKNRIYWWLSENNSWPKSQFGFRKYYSTNDAFLQLTLDIRQSFSEQKSVVALFLDIKGAYDSVQLELLINKLHNIGIPHKIANLIYNLYTNRQLFLYTRENVLGPQTANLGLPQGTILSPINYILYTYDLEKIIPNEVKIIQYADDICLYVSNKSIPNCLQSLDLALSKVSQWLAGNGFEISYNKTSVTTFTLSHFDFPPYVTLNNIRVTHNTSTKFLGIHMDTKLTWKGHITDIIKKSEKLINILRMLSPLRWGSDPIILLLLYRATIRSIN